MTDTPRYVWLVESMESYEDSWSLVGVFDSEAKARQVTTGDDDRIKYFVTRKEVQ